MSPEVAGSPGTAAGPVADIPVETTTYVGRDAELAELRQQLRAGGLVTLTGPGGVGKTRLALRAARAAGADFADGVVFVGLADLQEPALLGGTIVDRLRLGSHSARPSVEQLIGHLENRRLLLVLDNCEHLIEECALLVSALLRACTGVVVLATSRQSLGVAGEQVLPVRPLTVPEHGHPLAQLASSEAVRLLCQRARAVLPSFAVDENNVRDVIRLCRALDGLPLAIELAAVRLRSLSVGQLADRLDTRLTLLADGRGTRPDRHANLRALIGWSHELCDPPERLLWARASVFAGSFDLDAAEEVCSGDDLPRRLVLDVIDGLIDKSILLREEQDGVARYRLLETIRQYGEARLADAGETMAIRRGHRDWFLRLTAQFESEWFGGQQVAWIRRMRTEHANLRAALNYCTADPSEAVIGLRIVRSCKKYLVQRGLYNEGRLWLTRLLDTAPPDAPDRASAGWLNAFLALVQGDRTAYESALRTADHDAEATGGELDRGYVHQVRGYEALMAGDGDRSAALFSKAADIFAAEGDEAGWMWAAYNYGLAISLNGDIARGREVFDECLRICVGRGEKSFRSWALWSRSAAEFLLGDVDEAIRAGRAALRLQSDVDDRMLVAFALTTLSGCAVRTGQPSRAARLFGASYTAWHYIGANPDIYPAFAEPIRHGRDWVDKQLGVERTVGEFMIGASYTVEQALAYALSDDTPTAPAEATRPRQRPVPLTRREAQIADMVANGLTNREIADQLSIARRTAETHIDRIRVKLGVSNRTQIATWIVRNHAEGGVAAPDQEPPPPPGQYEV